jgi:hypothetical protein
MTLEHPQWPIFVKSFTYLDYEVVQALGFFLIARGIDNPRYLVYVANPYGEPRSAFQSGLDAALLAQSSNGMTSSGYLPFADGATRSNGDCFVIVLRKPEQFAMDQANGKDPAVGQNCIRIPVLIYWDGPRLDFVSPA